MTAEAGECNGRSEGSEVEFEGSKGEFERKRGGDLKDADIACRDGEEIGGSFVIVNGDSDDHSDRDLDLEEKSDPSTAATNGELKPENGEIGGKEESLAKNGVEDDEKFSEENLANDDKLEEKRSNGADIDTQEEKEEAEVDAEDELNVVGSGSDIKAEKGQESVSEAKLDSDAQMKGEEVEDDVDRVEVEESENKDNVESGSDVKVELEAEIVDGKDLGSSDPVEANQDSEASSVEAEEEEVLPRVEEQEREAEVLISESDAKEGLGSEVEEEDIKEPELVVTKTDCLMKSESVSLVGEEQEPASVMAESDDKGDVGEESQNSMNGVGETENAAESESAVETKPKQEPQTVVQQKGNVAEVESAVEEEPKQESDTEVEETEDSIESGSAVDVEPVQEPGTVVVEVGKTEVEELNEAKVLVEENDNQAETELVVEVEPEREPETVIGSAVLKSAEKIDAEESKEHEDVGTVNTAPEQLPLDNGVPGELNAVGDPLIDEPSGQLENGSTDSAAEIGGDSLKHELNGEARNIPLENFESPPMSHVGVTELVEEVSHSSADNIVKLEDNNEGMILSQPKTDLSSKERSLSDLDTGGDLEPQSEDLRPHKDTETEAKDSVEDVEADKEGVALNRMKQESESGSKSAKGSECVICSIEGDQSEPAHEHTQAAAMIQAPLETNIVKRQQVYMIKVPKFIDDELQKKIQEARSEVQKKTDEREEMSKETRKQAEIVNKYLLDYKAELAKERAVRAVFTAKRQELESKQELISRINNANSISDIDEKIRNMVHRQQHETISLKQEKQYIHDINQMKRLREQLSSKRASEEKIDEALSQRDEVEVKLKNLKKELDSQRAALSLAESNTKSAWNKYMDEVQCLRNLKEKHNAADGERQEAYLHLKKLRDQSAEKAKHFKMYKADQAAATNYIFSGDNQGLRSHCSIQVERIMNLWNNNAEFREQYIKYNMYSTLRRLGTSDGRSLGPGEEAPILRSHLDKISNTISAPSSKIEISETSSKVETPAPVFAAEVGQGNLIEYSAAKQVARTNLSAKSRSSTKPATAVADTVSNSEASKETEKENKLKKEEEELARKADELTRKEEELRKEKAAKEEELRAEKVAAELKEKLRQEQKAKAREAEERKRRKAEKAVAKAEYRAQKEAELKEKKKAKKETKKSGTVDATYEGTLGGSTPVSDTTSLETSQEHETSSASTSKKRSARPTSSMRQYNKVQAPVPLPLRYRGKRKMTTWMWVLLVILLVLILFFAGNYISFSTSRLPDFGF